jgi:hypothetical protein
MRLTIGLAAMASLCLLAGCNKGAANNSANAPAPAPAAPVENAAPPAETPAPAPANTAGGADRRASEIAQCVSGAPGHLPPGTDANAFCGCAVDKMLNNNTPQRDAVNQCAEEMHITVQTQE